MTAPKRRESSPNGFAQQTEIPPQIQQLVLCHLVDIALSTPGMKNDEVSLHRAEELGHSSRLNVQEVCARAADSGLKLVATLLELSEPDAYVTDGRYVENIARGERLSGDSHDVSPRRRLRGVRSVGNIERSFVVDRADQAENFAWCALLGNACG